jgi:HK97 family phage prohead protease
MKMELRVNQTTMTANDDGTLKVEGYVNKTNQPSNMLGRESRFIEVIKPGVWQRAIEKAKEIHFYAEHDKNKILSSTRNGSLQLREDENGLYMTATISPTSWGKDYYQLIKDGILQNMSFGFRAIKDSWRNMGDHFQRVVDEVELFEVSVVRDPAYASSTISARGIDLVEDEVPSSELNLRTIEIRSDEDIEKIAKRIFEMLQANIKVAEQHEEEPKDEVTDEEPTEKVEDQVVTEQPTDEPKGEEKVEDEPAEEEKSDEKTEDETPDEEVVEENKDEEIVDETPAANPAAKLRDFINQYKQEE